MTYKIDAPVIENNDKHTKIFYIMPSSDDELQSALEILAGYFKKEFGYDFTQYCKYEENSDRTGFLITQRALDLVKDIEHYPYRIIGGGCFLATENGNHKLDWIWFHPFSRNRGELKKIWPGFKEKFGDFSYTEPLSSQMKLFLEKHA
ncbi:hypothetical protein R0135_00640 [Congregibacter variabilis]|uniref:Uncharacterized protein n=1 Tax=Congregibacter variabilis TaxID=3081200 RepID=A0ABZ0I5A9_9GAMM|nr:hypothetical protein R0135_00640 [Congregibacter sp. IMCC43200]